MRSLIVSLMLVSLALAGCTDDLETDDQNGGDTDPRGGSMDDGSGDGQGTSDQPEPEYKQEVVFEDQLETQVGYDGGIPGCESVPVGVIVDRNAGGSYLHGVDHDTATIDSEYEGLNYTFTADSPVDVGLFFVDADDAPLENYRVAGDGVQEGTIPTGTALVGFMTCGPQGGAGDLVVHDMVPV